MTDTNKEQTEALYDEVPLDHEESLEEEVQEEELTETELLTKERDEYLAGWQRAQADMANIKKRHDEEKKMFTTLGKEQLLEGLIPVLDNFDAAFSNKEVWESVDANWRMGIEYIYSQFKETLANNGVEQFGEEGDTYDQHKYEAIESEGEGSVVTQVMQKGYAIGDRVIRPAKVKVG